MAILSSDAIHASCVSIGGAAVLIGGRSGQGKSDLALRLIDRGAVLVSDDYTLVRRHAAVLHASPPANIAGTMEVRGLGLVPMEYVVDVPVALFVDLDRVPERMPAPREARMIAGIEVPSIALAAFEASAPLKIELALKLQTQVNRGR